jgi:hypothetical protein
MTAPVTQQRLNGTGDAANPDARWSVRFIMPEGTSADALPKPQIHRSGCSRRRRPGAP